MMLVTGYPSKKALKASIGSRLSYIETALFSPEYQSNGTFTVAHRPAMTGGKGREFFAEITMKDDLIVAVK